jgi:hypothetical protein
MTTSGKPSPETVQTMLALQDVSLSKQRQDEISIEATRLLSGFSAVARRIGYFDEPAQYSAVLRRGANES